MQRRFNHFAGDAGNREIGGEVGYYERETTQLGEAVLDLKGSFAV